MKIMIELSLRHWRYLLNFNRSFTTTQSNIISMSILQCPYLMSLVNKSTFTMTQFNDAGQYVHFYYAPIWLHWTISPLLIWLNWWCWSTCPLLLCPYLIALDNKSTFTMTLFDGAGQYVHFYYDPIWWCWSICPLLLWPYLMVLVNKSTFTMPLFNGAGQ